MVKLLFVVFGTIYLAAGQVATAKRQAHLSADTISAVSVTIYPQNPLIEKDADAQYLNFDLLLKNNNKHVLQLSMVQISAFDNKGRMLIRKYLNQNGRAPSIALLGNTIIQPGESIDIFNPFYQFDRIFQIARLHYEFYFDDADNAAEIKHNKTRLPMDFDRMEIKDVHPIPYTPKTNLFLPLAGRLIVWDGHDFYSHHRRFPLGLPGQSGKTVEANSNRYAYDFVNIDAQGKMYKNDPYKKENWYVYGKPVFAPGSGKVIEAQNNIPDNSFSGKTVKSPDISDDLDPLGMGNHVIIDHGNGEFSVILHLEQGSVTVKPGDKLTIGQQIGVVGFSGDAIFPHVRYTVMNGANEQSSEGVPSNFNHYKLFIGAQGIPARKGRIDSGFIIESMASRN